MLHPHPMRTLWERLTTDPDRLTQERLIGLETHVKALYDHVKELERELRTLRTDEARRAAEHATAMDALSRLYKRVVIRILRENENQQLHAGDGPAAESDLDFRRRLGR